MQYENLDIWKRSKFLAIDVYRSTNHIRDYGFRDQITRSALSVPSNIAEGMERMSNPDKARFLVIAKGSIGEFKTQTDIGIAIDYINKVQGQTWMAEAEILSKMLGSFIRRLKTQ
ncbi:MAG: four helix bundle protein [Oleiphilaceae bacterium]|jgi:four helix bundle protein